MESAIPEHLQVERTTLSTRPAGFEPPVPAFVGRYPRSLDGFAVAYFGFQGSADELNELTRLMAKANGPLHVEFGNEVDSVGVTNEIATAYWGSMDGFRSWFGSDDVAQWWNALTDSVWVEAYAPSIERIETLQSHQGEPIGVLGLSEKFSEPILEHNYWGGSRDRLPIAQTDELVATGTLTRAELGDGRVRVTGHGNLAVIRSGQDWSATTGQERELYLETIEPHLSSGMMYLRDEGAAIGCYECRYVRDEDRETSYGYAVFRELADLERWAKSHDTHQKIFGTFLQVAGELQGNLQLRLYHEVLVVNADASFFEYVNCHPQTGLLAAV